MTYILYVPQSCRKERKTMSINHAAIIDINYTTPEPLGPGPNPVPCFMIYLKIYLCRPGGGGHKAPLLRCWCGSRKLLVKYSTQVLNICLTVHH
jgi:hypothetical protein